MSIISIKAAFTFAALVAATALAGCASESGSDTFDESDDALSGRARPIDDGSYSTETLYFSAPTKPATHFNPPRSEALRPEVSDVGSRGFKLDFKTPDGVSFGYLPISCTLNGADRSVFACDDVLPEGFDGDTVVPGLSINGRTLPPFWNPPRQFQASLFQRTSYVGVVNNKREFTTTETVTTTCQGDPSECAALGEFLAGPLEGNPLVVTPQVAIRRHSFIKAKR